MNEGERLMRLETKMENIEQKVDAVLEKLDKLDEMFASKWVEDWIVWGMRIVVGAVLVALLGVVISQTK